MEKILDIEGKPLYPGDKVVYSTGSNGIKSGVVTHLSKGGNSVMIKSDMGYKRQIGVKYSQIKIYKIDGNN